jgi:hypothetical protein
MKKIIFLVMTVILALSYSAGAQDDPFDPIVKAIKESDAKSLSSLFNLTVELRLPDNENTYSASQGEMIMKDFFKKYPPSSFDVIQKGTTDAVTRFAICNYVTGKGQYQVYINLRKEKDQYLIQKIKFEEKKQ